MQIQRKSKVNIEQQENTSLANFHSQIRGTELRKYQERKHVRVFTKS